MNDDGLSWGTKFVLFLILTVIGAIGSGVVTTLKMVRTADMPLWTQPDNYGRKQYGYINWWGTLLLVWIALVGAVFVVVPLVLQSYALLSAMWTDAG